MQNTFYNYLEGRRPITVKIDKELGFITFHFKEEQDRKFYDIPIDEWVSDRSITRQGCEDNWHNHMMQKTWFDQFMKKFIDDNTKN